MGDCCCPLCVPPPVAPRAPKGQVSEPCHLCAQARGFDLMGRWDLEGGAGFGGPHRADVSASAASKPSLSLLPWAALPEVAEVMQSGVAKHGAYGWREPGKHSQGAYLDKVLRHLASHLGGTKLDAESGKRHLAHAAADLLIALELGQ